MPICQNMGDYLFIEVNEPYSLKLLLSTIHEVAGHCQSDNLNKVLIDIRNMAGSPSIFDRFQIGVEIVKVWGSRIKAAVVAKSGIINLMTENTAVNRGVRIMVTSDVESAMRWLEIENQKEKPGAKFHD